MSVEIIPPRKKIKVEIRYVPPPPDPDPRPCVICGRISGHWHFLKDCPDVCVECCGRISPYSQAGDYRDNRILSVAIAVARRLGRE